MLWVCLSLYFCITFFCRHFCLLLLLLLTDAKTFLLEKSNPSQTHTHTHTRTFYEHNLFSAYEHTAHTTFNTQSPAFALATTFAHFKPTLTVMLRNAFFFYYFTIITAIICVAHFNFNLFVSSPPNTIFRRSNDYPSFKLLFVCQFESSTTTFTFSTALCTPPRTITTITYF